MPDSPSPPPWLRWAILGALALAVIVSLNAAPMDDPQRPAYSSGDAPPLAPAGGGSSTFTIHTTIESFAPRFLQVDCFYAGGPKSMEQHWRTYDADPGSRREYQQSERRDDDGYNIKCTAWKDGNNKWGAVQSEDYIPPSGGHLWVHFTIHGDERTSMTITS